MTEFARHHELHALGIETFFCDTYSPWQKGGVENAIGRMRRSLPRKTDLVHLPEERFTQMLQAYNNTPRKCLGYQTPAETFWNKVLRFKCESTFPFSRITLFGYVPGKSVCQPRSGAGFGATLRVVGRPRMTSQIVAPCTARCLWERS